MQHGAQHGGGTYFVILYTFVVVAVFDTHGAKGNTRALKSA